jgi:hypothetical protein
VAPVWVDIGTRPDLDPVDHDRPDDGWVPFLTLAEIAVLTRPPVSWQDFVQFVTEPQEMHQNGWMVVLDDVGAEAVADGADGTRNGSGPAAGESGRGYRRWA